MKKNRLEAFSDGLFAVAMTIMVLEMDAPANVTFKSLIPVLPVFLSYVLSFIYVAIYWINHHHLLAATKKINSKVLWANLGFLFWITLIPFTTSWVDENHISPLPVAIYGVVLLMCAVSFRILERLLFVEHDANSAIVLTMRDGRREKITIAVYVLAIAMAWLHPFISLGIYVVVALMWTVPNLKLEKLLSEKDICEFD